jgi:hypothetical protein
MQNSAVLCGLPILNKFTRELRYYGQLSAHGAGLLGLILAEAVIRDRCRRDPT